MRAAFPGGSGVPTASLRPGFGAWLPLEAASLHDYSHQTSVDLCVERASRMAGLAAAAANLDAVATLEALIEALVAATLQPDASGLAAAAVLAAATTQACATTAPRAAAPDAPSLLPLAAPLIRAALSEVSAAASFECRASLLASPTDSAPGAAAALALAASLDRALAAAAARVGETAPGAVSAVTDAAALRLLPALGCHDATGPFLAALPSLGDKWPRWAPEVAVEAWKLLAPPGSS